MFDLEFNVGDTVWFYYSDHKGKLRSGKVVYKAQIEGYSFINYIIAIPTGVDDLLIVRSGFTLSDSEHKEIGVFRGIF